MSEERLTILAIGGHVGEARKQYAQTFMIPEENMRVLQPQL
jgi:hypothetical protein